MCLQETVESDESENLTLVSAVQPFRAQLWRALRGAGRGFQLPLEPANSLFELLVLDGQLVVPHREMAIVPPPVEANLFCFVDRADHQPDADGEQLDLGDRDLDVAGDDQAFVEHPIENVDEAASASVADRWNR